MKQLMIGLVLAAGCLTSDIHAGVFKDNKKTVESLKKELNEYIVPMGMSCVSKCDLIKTSLNKLKANNSQYKAVVTSDLKVIKNFRDAFVAVRDRKPESNILKAIEKCSGQIKSIQQMNGEPENNTTGEANLKNYYNKEIVGEIAATRAPTPTGQVAQLGNAIINLFNTFKNLQTGQAVTAPSTTGGTAAAAPVAVATGGGGW